jgi:hypothetical protein
MKLKIKYVKPPENVRGIHVCDSVRFFQEQWDSVLSCEATGELMFDSTPFMPDGLFWNLYKEAQEKDETDKG